MFAVGWGANQFSPMLIVYRHALGLSAGEIAGLFAIYAATLIPGLLAGGPLSDRFGRRACVLPFAALSPVATLLLVIGPHSLPLIAAGRALAGLCSGMVIGPATAWVQDLSGGDALSARRAALALSAGFGLGPVVAAFLAQWAGDPLVVPYLPHLALGAAALVIGLGGGGAAAPHGRVWPATAGRPPRCAPGSSGWASRCPRRSSSARCRWPSSCFPRRSQARAPCRPGTRG
jgi:MFS family permease